MTRLVCFFEVFSNEFGVRRADKKWPNLSFLLNFNIFNHYMYLTDPHRNLEIRKKTILAPVFKPKSKPNEETHTPNSLSCFSYSYV